MAVHHYDTPNQFVNDMLTDQQSIIRCLPLRQRVYSPDEQHLALEAFNAQERQLVQVTIGETSPQTVPLLLKKIQTLVQDRLTHLNDYASADCSTCKIHHFYDSIKQFHKEWKLLAKAKPGGEFLLPVGIGFCTRKQCSHLLIRILATKAKKLSSIAIKKSNEESDEYVLQLWQQQCFQSYYEEMLTL